MHIFAVPRHQGDNKQDEYNRRTAVIFNPADDTTRQEYKTESDINVILDRFGIDAFKNMPTPNSTGTFDFTIGLQDAMHAANGAREVFAQLPEGLRAKYKTWQAMMTAAENGSLEKDLDRSAELLKERRARRIAELEEEEAIQLERAKARRRAEFEADPDRFIRREESPPKPS